MQIICIGSSAATSTRKSNGSPGATASSSRRARRAQIVLDAADHPRRQPGADQPPDLRVARVVHHVEHLARDGEVLQQRAAERPRAAGHRRVRLRITQHGKRFGVGGDRPEPLAVGRVVGRLVPVDRRLAAMHLEQVVREAVRRSCPDR